MIDRHPLEFTLMVLLALAIATLFVSWHLMAGPITSGAVLGLAVIKGRRILLDFLGLRNSPPIWRGLVTAWVVGIASLAWVASAAPLFI